MFITTWATDRRKLGSCMPRQTKSTNYFKCRWLVFFPRSDRVRGCRWNVTFTRGYLNWTAVYRSDEYPEYSTNSVSLQICSSMNGVHSSPNYWHSLWNVDVLVVQNIMITAQIHTKLSPNSYECGTIEQDQCATRYKRVDRFEFSTQLINTGL